MTVTLNKTHFSPWLVLKKQHPIQTVLKEREKGKKKSSYAGLLPASPRSPRHLWEGRLVRREASRGPGAQHEAALTGDTAAEAAVTCCRPLSQQ